MSGSSVRPSPKPLLSNRSYNALKPTATTILPAIGALYFALASIWHLPKAEEVVGSIAALNVFLGLLISLSTKKYNNSDVKYSGDLMVEKGDGTNLMFSLALSESPQDLEAKDEATFKVKNH